VEQKDAALKERVQKFAGLTPAEQKQAVLEVTKHFQDKGAKLTANDANVAFQLASALEDAGFEAYPQTCKSLVKMFSAASDEKVASMLKQLEVIGNRIDITGKTTDGKEFDLAKLKGKVVLVDFWATWCGPCIQEIPNIRTAYKNYKDKGFEVIGVSLDRSDDAIEKFVKKENLPWSSINVEDSRRLADKYEVNSIPQPYLIGPDGRVISIRARGPQLERLLERLLGEKK
jgi:thiol-disulfide isomerase/thioredoxin